MKTAIIDLASMLHKLWHVDHDNVTNRVISFLKTLQYDDIIVAIDSPPYKRKDTFPQYKANRDTPDPEQIGCFDYTIKKVLSEGFKIASAEGWEADDVIATIINTMTDKGTYDPSEVIVYGVDKDLLQITAICEPISGEQQTAQSRFNINPCQVPDYLALIGDTSDNVPGVKGIGPANATGLLTKFQSVDGIYEAIEKTPELFTKPAIFEALKSSRELVNTSLQLVTLNCNVDVKYRKEDIKPIDIEKIELPSNTEVKTETVSEQQEPQNAIVLRTEPLEYRRSLEPVGVQEAWKMSNIFQRSGMYPHFKGPEQIMMVIMRGRELGFGATSSLDLISMVNGKPTMSASGMLAKVISHRDICKYMICDLMCEDRSTWTTHRTGHPKPVSVTFSYDEAVKMEYIIPEGVIIKDKYGKQKETKDNWKKQPSVMIQWRACCRLMRQVYPDLINGLYAKEELED